MEEAVNYGSDTSVPGDARTMSNTPMSELHPPTTLSSFAERDDAIITNPLDEQQELAVQRDESARRHAQWSRPLRTSVIMCSLHSVWRNVYVKRLAKSWQRGPLAKKRTKKTTTSFAGCTALVASTVCTLRASVSVADVRLVRKLRYDYAKLKARGRLRNRTRYASATTVAASAGQTVTNNPPTDTTSRCGNGLGLEMTLATMFKNIHGVWAILPKENLILP
uniref:Uncharacterized protein n=1 Tax=Hyaloperonospora arabidopsidis (strain Emoy2) TaxID=559515 RepID=M4BU34_HYAAE